MVFLILNSGLDFCEMVDTKGSKLCGKCQDELPIDGEHASCRLSNEGFHFGECSMRSQSWKGLGKNGQAKWVCVSCRKKEKSTSQSEEDPMENIPLDMTAKIDKLLEMKVAIDEIKLTLSHMSNTYDDLIKDMKSLRVENQETKKELGDVKKSLVKSEENVKQLTERVNELEQYGRRVNLEIHGVSVRGPTLEGEKTSEVIKDLAKEIGMHYIPERIHKLHRLQRRSDGKPPAILIQFMTTASRDDWLRAGKKARLTEEASGNKIYFNENLTYFYKGLLRETKARAKMYGHRFVWFQNGKIFVKKDHDDKSVIVVRCISDVNKIGLL